MEWWEVFKPEALNYSNLSRLIPWILSVPTNPILTHFPLSGSLCALRSDRTNFWFGIHFPHDPHASGSVNIFVWQGLSFSKLSTSSLSLLDPYSKHVGVNISLNNSTSLSFFNVYAPPIHSSTTDSRNELIFPLHSFHLQKSFHSGGFQLPSPPLGFKTYL